MLTWASGSFGMVGQDLTAPRAPGKLFSLF